MEYPGGEWNDNMAKHFEDNTAALPIYDVRRNKLNYPYCLRLPVFHKIRACKSLVPVKEGMERMTLLLIHCKVVVLRVRS